MAYRAGSENVAQDRATSMPPASTSSEEGFSVSLPLEEGARGGTFLGLGQAGGQITSLAFDTTTEGPR